MNIFWSLVLGAVQGLTEFLPVSSSGHLVIFQSLIPGFSQPGVLFDVVLHAGTLLAIIVYFKNDILSLKKGYLYLLLIGTLPAATIGFLFSDPLEKLFLIPVIVGFALVTTGIFNYLTDKNVDKDQKLDGKKSLMIGIMQTLAIIPGISRSGSTIFAGTALGISRADAAKFSFLLSIPSVAGASVYQLIKYSNDLDIDFLFFGIGFASAFLVGYFSIKLTIKLLQEKSFKYFSIYTFVLGAVVIIVNLI